ncbi:uncharacterized protein perm1b [Austrofundulus limnaeus]|uniref:Uncharacterized protein LOC106516044 n=1 Tax=Austrofundulus limnaeus TaxID=52670 RepID=A0A2I4B1P0_AUSLI|nr:PREDICTED: uncharacterized protein LOC106516044 [Austrofundulus limnaeus]XP_013861662.1 PREDICTED: uncharacterized protein LOC106516044 [Austrofundulus limnaeus]
MDDFDHSIHIAENDWSSFYDESEECDLLQPSLACLDDSELSDSADPDQQETKRSPDANSCIKLSEQLNQSGTQGSEVDAATGPKLGGICGGCPGKNVKEVVHEKTERETVEEAIDNDVNSLQKESKTDHSSEETEILTEDVGVQTASDLRSTEKPDRAGLSAEKERWFVTVNESPARRRGRPTSVKKKRKQKKARKGGLTGVVGRLESSDGGKPNGTQESEQRRETQSNQSIGLEKYPSDGMKANSVKSLNQVLEDDAAEAVQEAQHPLQDRLTENIQFQCSSSLACDDMTENTGTDRAHGAQMSPQSETAASCERYKVATAEPSVTSPSCQKAAVMPDDSSTRPETPEPLTVTNRGSASARSPEDEHSHIPACSVADSLKTYAKTVGKTKPVYAISPFWDEMEKLTIDDILHVRKKSCLPSKSVQEKPMPNTANRFFDCNQSDSSLMNVSDTADSDYFTQPDEFKSDCCGQLLTSDFEEECSHVVDASRNPSTSPHRKNKQSPSSYLLCEDDSEGKETPVPLEYIVEHHLDNQETQTLTLWPRQKYNVQTFKTEDLSLLPLLNHYMSGLSLSRHLCLEEDTGLKPNCSLVAVNPTSFLSHTDLLDAQDQVSFPEIVEYFSTESEANTESGSFIVYNPEMFAAPDFNSTLCEFKDTPSFSPQTSLEQPIPIFSCSYPTIRDLTFPKQHRVFLTANCEREGEMSPFRLVSRSFIWADLPASSAAAAVSGSHCWKSLASVRKIYFPVKGSFCCRGSGAWMFPAESEEIHVRRWNPTVRALSEGKLSPDSSQVFRELEEQQETIWSKRHGMFSTVKQSDMCLVCIAFASWVLRSSDPEAADAWKATLLANVSALSAIQYLRKYMKRGSPRQDEI